MKRMDTPSLYPLQDSERSSSAMQSRLTSHPTPCPCVMTFRQPFGWEHHCSHLAVGGRQARWTLPPFLCRAGMTPNPIFGCAAPWRRCRMCEPLYLTPIVKGCKKKNRSLKSRGTGCDSLYDSLFRLSDANIQTSSPELLDTAKIFSFSHKHSVKSHKRNDGGKHGGMGVKEKPLTD